MTVAPEQGERRSGMAKRHLSPTSVSRPFGRYHQAVEVTDAKRVLFLSGQLGVRPDGTVPEAVEAQTALAFAAIDALLQEAGLGRDAVVRLNVFLTEPGYREDYMAVRDRWVAEPPPASTLVIVKALALPACKVEIEATAFG